MSRLFWPFGFGFMPKAYVGEVKKGYVYASVMNWGICEGYYLNSRGNRDLMCITNLKKKTFWPNNNMTCNHDPCTHTCTNHSVPHHHLQPSPKSETLATIQTLNTASVSSPPSSTTESRRNNITTPSFISPATQNNLSSPPYLNGKCETHDWTTMSQIATLTHTLMLKTHKRVLRLEKGEIDTYKRDWTTTMEATFQPLRRQQWRRPVRRRTSGGETKLQLCGWRNLCGLQQWHSKMEERKMAAAPREEDEQWRDFF